MTAADQFLQIAYPDRQLIVVLNDADFEKSLSALPSKWGGSMLVDSIVVDQQAIRPPIGSRS